MRVCREYHIPHSHFSGGPLRWNAMDRDKALAYEVLLREQCPRCGTFEEDWWDMSGGTKRPLMEPTWAAAPKHCMGCDEIDRLRDHVEKEKRSRGVHYVLVPFEDLDDYDTPESEPVIGGG